jgi:hypothetical protein
MKNAFIIVVLFLSTNFYCQVEVYENDEFSIEYPTDWELNTTGVAGSIFVVSSPLSSNDDKFRENVNILTQNLKGMNIDLDKYVILSKKQIYNLPKAKLIVSKRVKKGEDEYHTFIVDAFMNGMDLKVLQHYFIKDEIAYVLTYTQVENDKDGYFKVGEKIINSFKKKNK